MLSFKSMSVNFLKVHRVSSISGKMKIDENLHPYKLRSSPNLFHFILQLSWLYPTYLSNRGLKQELGQ